MSIPTTGAAELPWPPVWPSRSIGRALVHLTVLGVIAVFLAGVAAVALSTGDTGVAVSLAAAAGLVGVIMAGAGRLLWLRRGTGAVVGHTTETGERGVRIPYSRWMFGWLLVLLAALILGFGALGLAVLIAGPASLDSSNPGRVVGLAVLGAVVLPYLAWFLLEAALGRVARGQVILTPRGIHHRAMTHEEFLSWESLATIHAGRANLSPVISVLARDDAGWQSRRTSWVGFQRQRTEPAPIVINGGTLAVDPAVLYHALGYYLTRPQARAELGTEQGVQRIQTGNLEAGGFRPGWQ